MNYTDPMVVSAFNSCIDMEKFKRLPYQVQERIKKLFQKHRIKPVCFFDQCGFGLRVYMDNIQVQVRDDECSMLFPPGITHQTDGYGRLDEDGRWMRCPPSLYEEQMTRPTGLVTISSPSASSLEEEVDEGEEEEEVDEEEEPQFIIANSRGTLFVGPRYRTLQSHKTADWVSRSSASKFNRSQAQRVARAFPKSVILEA